MWYLIRFMIVWFITVALVLLFVHPTGMTANQWLSLTGGVVIGHTAVELFLRRQRNRNSF